MAKVKKPLLPPTSFNPSVFNKTETELPTAENVTTAAAVLTGKEIPLKAKKEEKTEKEPKSEKEKPKKDKKEAVLKDKSNRVGITALIERSLLKKVKIHALEKGISMSDVCNAALLEYLDKQK